MIFIRYVRCYHHKKHVELIIVIWYIHAQIIEDFVYQFALQAALNCLTRESKRYELSTSLLLIRYIVSFRQDCTARPIALSSFDIVILI